MNKQAQATYRLCSRDTNAEQSRDRNRRTVPPQPHVCGGFASQLFLNITGAVFLAASEGKRKPQDSLPRKGRCSTRPFDIDRQTDVERAPYPMVLAKEHEIRRRYAQMARDEFLELSSMGVQMLTEVTCLRKGSQGRDHVPIVVQSLFFCHFLPLANADGDIGHFDQLCIDVWVLVVFTMELPEKGEMMCICTWERVKLYTTLGSEESGLTGHTCGIGLMGWNHEMCVAHAGRGFVECDPQPKERRQNLFALRIAMPSD